LKKESNFQKKEESKTQQLDEKLSTCVIVIVKSIKDCRASNAPVLMFCSPY